MTRKRKPKKGEPAPAPVNLVARNTAMFKDWIGGNSYEALGVKYSMGRGNVCIIAKKYKWAELKKELQDKLFSLAMADIKGMTLSMTRALKRDMEKIVASMIRENRTLTTEERNHFRIMLDRFLKESRLEDGKPTDTVGGSVSIELCLPPGVKRFGIIPPDNRVKLVEAEESEAVERIDLDSLEIDPKDIK
jgi:hypothetical protein